MAPSAEQARHAENVFHIALRRCETLWSAREIASMALSAEQARHTQCFSGSDVIPLVCKHKAYNYMFTDVLAVTPHIIKVR